MIADCNKRRWFQFGLRTMMLLPVLVGGIWWWSTWPERTARKFLHYLSAGDVEAARNMIESPVPPGLESLWTVSQKGDSKFIAPLIQSRSLADWLYSRGEFNVDADQQTLRTYFGSFVASRGSVIPTSELEPARLEAYKTSYLSAEVALARIKAEFSSNSPARITVDPTANILIVHASQKTQGALRTLLMRLDQEAEKLARARVDRH